MRIARQTVAEQALTQPGSPFHAFHLLCSCLDKDYRGSAACRLVETLARCSTHASLHSSKLPTLQNPHVISMWSAGIDLLAFMQEEAEAKLAEAKKAAGGSAKGKKGAKDKKPGSAKGKKGGKKPGSAKGGKKGAKKAKPVASKDPTVSG